MPLLEYRCSNCERVFERLVPRTDGANRAECPDCGEATGRRLLSLFAQARAATGTDAMPSAGGGCCGGGACGCR